MAKDLHFDKEFIYPDSDEGITIPVALSYGGKPVRVFAKVDPGAAVCLFSREDGQKLNLAIEEGIPLKLRSLTGSLDAFGHEVTIQTGDLVFQSMVYFAKYPGLPCNLLGRQGWLRKLRLAIIDYDNLLYLSDYNS